MIPIGFNKYTKPDVPFLLYGSYSIFVSGLFCMGFQFYSLRRNLKIVTGQLVNFPLILFFVIAGLLFFPMQTYQLRHWDEFTHWGLAVKDMLCYHAFPAGDTTIMFPNYLPGSTLSHYYISILTTNTEGTWYYSQLLLLLSGIFVFTVAIPKKHCFFILLILFFGLTLLFTFNETGLISLYTDALLGIFFGAVLYMYLYLSITNILPYKKTVLLLIPPLCTLVLIKHVGIIFVSVVFVMIFFDLILSYFISVRQETIKIPLPWNRVKIRNFIVNIILFLSLLVLPTAMNTSWTIRIKHCDIKSQADTNANAFGRKMGKTLYKIHSQIPVYQWHWVLFSSKNADQFAEVTRSSLSDWQWEVLQNYEKIIKERPLYAFFSSYTSIISILFLSCLLCLSPSMCGFRYKFLIFTFVMFLGCCGYLLFILLTFLFAFAPNFSIAFASYERYVGTYFYAWLLCLFSFSLFCFQKSLTHGNKDCYF
jgi:hypothetical protein